MLISINAKRFISFLHHNCKMELPFDKNKRIFHSRADNPSSFLHLSCLKWGAEHSQLVIERINHSSTFGNKNKRTQTSSSPLLKQKKDSKDLGFVILGAGPWLLSHFNQFAISTRPVNLKLTDNPWILPLWAKKSTLRSSSPFARTNIAKGTTYPRVEYSSQSDFFGYNHKFLHKSWYIFRISTKH